MAQWIACLTSDQEVAGSIPVAGTIFKNGILKSTENDSKIPCSLMVRITRFHRVDPGSIPGMEAKRI